LTLVDELSGLQIPLQLPPKPRAIPRSSTSASLSVAFERSASASQASVPKRQGPSLRSRQWSESSDSVNDKTQSMHASTWSNKFASKSKRFYQLMASNISSQSLSEQAGRQTSNGEEGGSPALPSIASSSTLFGLSTTNSFSVLRQQQEQQLSPRYQPQQAASTIILRPENARSMIEWAEALSRCLGTSPRVLRSPASLSVLPSHARARRPTLTSISDKKEEQSYHPFPGTTSSLVSAAMASRRKREDSAAKIVALKNELQKSASKSSSPPLPSPTQASSEQSKSLLAALKSRRRASLEIFSSALTRRQSSIDLESRGSKTNSTGNSTRSSICCAGEAARMSWERSNRINNNGTATAPPTSLAVFSSTPFSLSNNRMVFTSARRRSSIKSNHSTSQQYSGNGAPVAPSAIVAASLTGSASYLDMNTSSSSAEDFDSQHRSAESSNMPSPLSQGPVTPQAGDSDLSTDSRGDEVKINGHRLAWQRSSPGALGLNLYYDNFKDSTVVTPDSIVPTIPYRPFEAQSIIVESPTREDLATILANNNNNQDIGNAEGEKLSIVRSSSPFRRVGNSKLATSPSMPVLRSASPSLPTYKAAPIDSIDEDDSKSSSILTQLQTNSLRFATFGKANGRRPMLQHQPKAIVAKPTSSGVTASSSARSNLMNKISSPTRVSSPLQRPSTSTGFRDPSTITAVENINNNVPSNKWQNLPIVERILPPEEMIATFDRLRSQSSMSSLHQPISPSYKIRPSISRPVLVDMRDHSLQQQNRNTNSGRPRQSAMTAF
jgi:hypothetical protein